MKTSLMQVKGGGNRGGVRVGGGERDGGMGVKACHSAGIGEKIDLPLPHPSYHMGSPPYRFPPS